MIPTDFDLENLLPGDWPVVRDSPPTPPMFIKKPVLVSGNLRACYTCGTPFQSVEERCTKKYSRIDETGQEHQHSVSLCLDCNFQYRTE